MQDKNGNILNSRNKIKDSTAGWSCGYIHRQRVHWDVPNSVLTCCRQQIDLCHWRTFERTVAIVFRLFWKECRRFDRGPWCVQCSLNNSSFAGSRKLMDLKANRTLEFSLYIFWLPVKEECPLVFEMAFRILLPCSTRIYVNWSFRRWRQQEPQSGSD
jgi:hypothetical protein